MNCARKKLRISVKKKTRNLFRQNTYMFFQKSRYVFWMKLVRVFPESFRLRTKAHIEIDKKHHHLYIP